MAKRFFLLFLVCLVSLVGFSAIKNPDTIITATYGSPETFDPQAMWDTSSGEVCIALYDNLIMYDGDTINFLPLISTEVPTIENGLLTPDGKKYTFPIRKGVKFHTGTSLPRKM